MQQTDKATGFPPGSRVLHIGLPKTGTSTVQEALHGAREDLARHGVMYAGSAKHSYLAAKAAVGQVRPWFRQGAEDEWAQLTAEIRGSEARCTIASSEVLSSATPAQITDIVGRLGGDVQVVVTLRALAPVLSSIWQQSLRNQLTTPFPDWLDEMFGVTSGVRGHPGIWSRYDVGRLLRHWGPVVGEEAITFVIVDPGDRHMLLRSFEDLLSVPEGTLQQTSWANQSLPYPEAELMRQVAQAVSAETDHLTWLRTAGGGWSKRRLKELAPQLPPHRIRVPRSIAQQANEATEPWIEALRASKATVVGDPCHLLVDPADFPESTSSPDMIRIDSAAALAHVFYLSALRRGRQERSQRTRQAALAQFGSRQLLDELRRRALRKARRLADRRS